MKHTFSPLLFLTIVLMAIVACPDRVFASFAPDASGLQITEEETGGKLPGAGMGTKQSGMIAQSTDATAKQTNKIAEITASAAPTQIVSGNAEGQRKKVAEAHKNNLDRARENRDAGEDARHRYELPMDGGKAVATARTGQKSARSTAEAPNNSRKLQKELRTAAVNRDPNHGSGLYQRFKKMFKGAGCEGFNTCDGATSSIEDESVVDRLALGFARYCEGIGICDILGGGAEKIAALRARAGLPMYAALTGDGVVTATLIAAGSGGADVKGCSIDTGCLQAMPNIPAQPGNKRYEAAMGAKFVRAPMGPDKSNSSNEMSGTNPEITVASLRNAAVFAEVSEKIDCQLGGSYSNPQQGSGDKEMRNLLKEDGYQGDSDTQNAGLSQNEQQRVREAQLKKSAAAGDTEGQTPAGRIQSSGGAFETASAATKARSEAGKGCTGGVLMASNGETSSVTGALLLLEDKRVIALLKDPQFVNRVVAYRTILPEIYAEENKVSDRLMYAFFEREFGREYAQFAQKRREKEMQSASLESYMNAFGVNPVDTNPTVLAMSDLIQTSDSMQKYAADLHGFAGRRLPTVDVSVADSSKSLKDVLASYNTDKDQIVAPAMQLAEKDEPKAVLISAGYK